MQVSSFEVDDNSPFRFLVELGDLLVEHHSASLALGIDDLRLVRT